MSHNGEAASPTAPPPPPAPPAPPPRDGGRDEGEIPLPRRHDDRDDDNRRRDDRRDERRDYDRRREYDRREDYRRRDDHYSRDRRDDRGRYDDREDRGRYDDRDRRDRRDDRYDRDRRDARADAEARVSRGGLLCDDDDDRGGNLTRSKDDRRSDRDRDDDHERDRDRRRKRNMWDDTGGRDHTELAQAQATHLAMTQMWAQANPSLMMAGPVQPSGRKQRELYVGNLAVGIVNQDMLKEFFSSILTLCPGYSPTMGPPVAVVQLSGEGKFAFVEFRDELIAVTALQLDKVEFAGRPLNIGRPAGYMPAPGVPLPAPLPLPPGIMPGMPSMPRAAAPDPAAAAAVAALVGGSLQNPLGVGMGGVVTPSASLAAANASHQASRKQRELYIGNLPTNGGMPMIAASQLKELFRAPMLTMPNMDESAGPIVINVDLSTDGKFAFVEFRDETICTIALTLFDKMEVCGRALNVGRPRGYVDPTQPLGGVFGGGLLGTAATAGLLAPSQALPMAPSLVPSGLATLNTTLPPPPPGPPPTRCVKLEGMLTAEMLSDDQEYTEICDDIKTECETNGPVTEMKVVRTGPMAGVAFVKFEMLVAAAKARESLDKRQFDGNTVKASFVSEEVMAAVVHEG